MIIFRKAKKPHQTLNDLDAYIGGLGYEPIRLLDREISSWGEISYDELAALIESGNYQNFIDWQERYAKVINEILAPLWIKAIEEASKRATKGMIILSDSHEEVKEFLRTRGGELLKSLSAESRRAIINIIERGIFEQVLPKVIAQQVRPLIGLTERQAQQNLNYRAKVYQEYLNRGASEKTAKTRSDKAALRYAAKQHRYRAETIVLTETAFAYNHGADMGVRRAIRDNLMSRCEMIWTTAGTNRVCSRCLELKGKVIGTTDEEGIQIPPLHPRCRCAIIYREIGFSFDVQRFANYAEQVESHGGSGKIKPDRIIEGHERTPSKTTPHSIIDHKDYKGAIDKRIYYDETGQPYFEINTTNHGNAKNHPYGAHGEHAHDITWANGKAIRSTRELKDNERKDNGDIL